MQIAPVAIIGAGPIGLEMAAALKRSRIDYLQFDAGPIGSTLTWWAPGTRFFSSPERLWIAGVPLTTRGQEKATREEYLDYLRAVTEQFDLQVRTFEPVRKLERAGAGGFFLTTAPQSGPSTYRAQRIVLAIGDMHRPRLLNIPGEDLPHVSHYFQDPHLYFRRRVLIVGGRNSAVEAAIRCHRVGANVAISYRQNRFDPDRIKYWLLPEINWLISKGHVAFFPETTPVAITPSGVRLRGRDGGEREAPADTVLLLTGYEQDSTLFEQAGVELEGENRSPRHNPHTMETNVPGLYVAGTAAAGTQHRFKLFIETAHVHVNRILAAITGQSEPADQTRPAVYDMPES
jgi:thioredoxin reductase (NADPH)